ncbi:division/cell wall cluster transcriptional repressor MraZ [Arabiibacter massiliensis]|uniref:division/cell wall cluster transcriptional repressor MraZ n=1 Tax=Arabiibacter massiliensis TaxID=1870985 RepID=UPI0009B98E23|nr:division/cell wall cluster transcriptional repressor MraZ [Arabiibacter massiliensis]
MAEGADNVVNMNGKFRHKVDAKGRMSLPATFRKALPTDLVVTIDPFDECLRVYVVDAFNDWVEQVFVDAFPEGYKSNDRQHVRLRSELKGRADDVSVDSAGRIMLPADQRAAVGIDKDVVVIGNTGYFEIWDAKRYDEPDEDVDLKVLFPGRKS